MRQHPLRNTAQHQLFHTASTMRAHHDEVGPGVPGIDGGAGHEPGHTIAMNWVGIVQWPASAHLWQMLGSFIATTEQLISHAASM